MHHFNDSSNSLNKAEENYEYEYLNDEQIIQIQLNQAIEEYKKTSKSGSDAKVQVALSESREHMRHNFIHQAWEKTNKIYEYIYHSSEELLQIQLTRNNKETWLKETQGLAAQAAYALAKNNKLQEAVIALETGLARLLSEALARDRADLEQLKTIGHADLYDRYKQIVEKWHFLTQQPEINQDALRATRDELDATIEAIQQIQGFEQFLKPPTFATIQQAAQDTTLIYILATEAGGLALLVGEKIIPVWLPALTDIDLHNILNNEDQTGYLDSYFNRKENQKAWHTALDTTTEWLWQTVMAPIIDALPPQSKVTLIPVGLLGLLPLHAAWTTYSDTPNNRIYAMDVLNIHYSPNARTLTEARLIAERVTPDTLLAVDEPLPVHAEPLPHSTHEVQSIISHFPKFHQFQHQNATREAILNALPHCTVLHFSCHGLAQLDNPLSSGLVMACLDDNKEQFITLADVLNLRLTGVRLATLSACETNISGTTLPDEVVNFSAGLLQAGVAGVIASLWSVEGLSTLMLMTYFYELWQTEQLEPIEALRQAQQWMKDSTNQEKLDYVKARFPKEVYKKLRNEIGFSPLNENNFAHPYYWGAFGMVGE
jgi:CHAT domain-containing protein